MTALVLLAQLCTVAAPLRGGDPAPCTGILWPVDKTRDAIACKKVDLPDCERRLTLVQKTLAAELGACERSLGACKGQEVPVAPAEAGTALWPVLAASAVGFLGGALAMALLR